MPPLDSLRPTSPDIEPAAPGLMSLARICGTGLGLIILLVGLWAVLRVFLTLLGHFTAPEKMSAGLAAWSQALAGIDAGAEINGQKVDLKGIVVVGSYWLGWIVLSWLSVSLLYAGARIISWTTGDQEAVKRILNEAFGNWRKLHERE